MELFQQPILAWTVDLNPTMHALAFSTTLVDFSNAELECDKPLHVDVLSPG